MIITMFGNIHEECGIFGVFGQTDGRAKNTVLSGLYSLQHRGEEGCGISVNDDGVFKTYKDVGLLSEVFTPQTLEQLGHGTVAVGHTRYGTTGSNNPTNCQPIVVRHIKGSMSLVHNGNLTNALDRKSVV